MTKEEALKVAAIVSTADGGCHVCALRLADQLIRHFPLEDFDWRMEVQRALDEQL